jgi:hypothetical protein
MPQAEPQSMPKPHPNAGRRFGVPIIGHQGKLARIAERQARAHAKAAQLAEAFGGLERMTALDREFLDRAADLLLLRAQRTRNAEDVIRFTNTARGLIAAVERRAGRRETPNDEFVRLLGGEP